MSFYISYAMSYRVISCHAVSGTGLPGGHHHGTRVGILGNHHDKGCVGRYGREARGLDCARQLGEDQLLRCWLGVVVGMVVKWLN